MSDSHSIPIEMHCHTVFSVDAKRTPEELIDQAASKDVQILSITDHNHLGAQERAIRHAQKYGIQYVTGVEIDAMGYPDTNFHFVCFGFDLHHPALLPTVYYTFKTYQPRFLQMLPYFKEFGLDLTVEALESKFSERYPTNPDPTLNQWFAKEVLMETNQIKESTEFGILLKKIKQRQEEDGIEKIRASQSFEVVRDAIHQAGGKILLAHVNDYYPNHADRQIEVIQDLLARGMDGFELYHWRNTQQPEFHKLKEFAQRTDCYLSGGSDCHDTVTPKANQPFGTIAIEPWIAERLVTG